MPRTAEQNAKMRDRAQTKIIYSSIKPFAIRGLSNSTVDDVTKGCGCSHGLFYHYFPSTEALYTALSEYRREKFAEYLFPVEELKRDTPKDGVKRIEEFYANALGQHDTVIYMLRLDAMYHTDVARKDLAKGPDAYEGLLDLVKRGQESGDFIPGDPEDIANLILDAINGSLSRRIAVGREAYKPIETGLLSQFLFKH